jgi:hypothetical protein
MDRIDLGTTTSGRAALEREAQQWNETGDWDRCSAMVASRPSHQCGFAFRPSGCDRRDEASGEETGASSEYHR